jgi:hypothetical protein
MPAKVAQVALKRNSAKRMRPVWIPARSADAVLPPVARMCRPGRVRRMKNLAVA